ncbi:TVP38/TMEM64 family protein [Haloferula chungangensis]|uniref:TVP38/TMEM64 family protein n=1 Tax=Haloferula chungangensis TaxID=1048331 RepID=A0ABW2L084_9BACT
MSTESETSDQKESTKPWSLIASAAILLTFAISVAASQELRDFLVDAWNILTSGDQERISQWADGFGAWGPLIIILMMVLQMFLIIVPSWLLMVVAVLAYGPWWGALIAIGAVAAASSFGYAIGNLIGEHGLERLINKKTLDKVQKETERYGIWAIVVTRINPLLSNDAISFVAGLIRMGYWKFLAATVGGILPLTVAIAVFGSDWEKMKTTLIWISVISLLGLVAKVLIDRRKQ